MNSQQLNLQTRIVATLLGEGLGGGARREAVRAKPPVEAGWMTGEQGKSEGGGEERDTSQEREQ